MAAHLLRSAQGRRLRPSGFRIVFRRDAESEREANVLKIISIAGYTYKSWTPLMLRLETTLQGDVAPGEEEVVKQTIQDDGSADTVVTFLYLNGGYLEGSWNFGMVGYVNGPLLWADALDYFRTCMA